MTSETGNRLRLAIITDIHHGRPSLTKKGPEALGLLNRFVEFTRQWDADLVIDLGDRITDVDNATDRKLTADVAGAFQRVSTTRRHLLGNHDLEYMSPEEGEELLGVSMTSHSLDIKGHHLVFWQANTRVDGHEGFALPQQDLDWLADDLSSTDLPSIVFTHVPLDGASMTGNYYFEANPQHATYVEAAEVRRTIADAGNVILCAAGHVHWNNLSMIGGTPYISIQSLTESYTTPPDAAAAWATIEIDDHIHWQVHGNDPVEMKLPRRELEKAWIEPLPSFEELRRRRSRTEDAPHQADEEPSADRGN